MSNVWLDSFTTYTAFVPRYDVVNNSVSLASGRFDSGAMSTANGNIFVAIPAASSQFVSFAFKPASLGQLDLFAFTDNASTPTSMGTAQIVMQLMASGAVRVCRNSTQIAISAAGLVTAGAWNSVALDVLINNTSGSITLRVNGTVAATFSGNTRGASDDTINQFVIGMNFAPFNQWGTTVLFDDLAINNGSGTLNNATPGDLKIQGGLATGNGSLQNFSQNIGASARSTAYAVGATILDSNSNVQRVTTAGTTGSGAPTWSTTLNATTTDGTVTWTCLGTQAAWKLINELNADDDLSYLSDATVGDQSTFTFPSVSGAGVTSVMLFGRCRKDDVGSRAVRLITKNGGTVADSGSDTFLTTSYGKVSWVEETDPATGSAWTVSGLNTAEHGGKVSA